MCTPVTRCAWLYGLRRSISIFDGKKGELVWDSGDFIEKFTADPANGFSDIFNSEGGEKLSCFTSVVLSFSAGVPAVLLLVRLCPGSRHQQRQVSVAYPLLLLTLRF